MSGTKGAEKPSIVIRREEVVEGGHHGGAWKVAYADFVTAMMAFFLLMWLLNATTQEQRIGLADYFSPTNETSRNTSGFGAIFGGRTPNVDGSMASDRGAMEPIRSMRKPMVDVDDDDGDAIAQQGAVPESGPALRNAAQPRQTPEQEEQDPDRPSPEPLAPSPKVGVSRQPGMGQAADPAAQEAARQEARQEAARQEMTGYEMTRRDVRPEARQNAALDEAGPSDARLRATRAEAERREREAFERAAQQMRDAVRADPSLDAVARQLAIDMTPEGLRIQILDEDKQPMFATGSAALNERARALLAKVAPVLLRLPQAVSISGYTDAAPFRGGERSNWDLSAERANTTRRLLAEAGLPEARMRGVAGHADRDPLLPADPFAAANRRVAITVLREARGAPAGEPPREARGARPGR